MENMKLYRNCVQEPVKTNGKKFRILHYLKGFTRKYFSQTM